MLGALSMATTARIMKAKQKAVLGGPAASVRTKNKTPAFLFYAPEGFSPTDYWAVKLEKKGNSREAVVGAMGTAGASGGFGDKNILKFASEKAAPRRYLIKFEAEISSGEYCFYPASALQVTGEAVTSFGRLYDFGID